MTGILFELVFPLVVVGLLIIIFIVGIIKRKPKQEFMSLDEFIMDWLKDHGQAHKIDEQFAKMKKDPSGKFYMPMTYKGGKLFIKLGLSPNQVSIINLLLSFLIFYGVIMAGYGHSLDLFAKQPLYGSWFFLLALLVLGTGIIDGIDGAIARLLGKKTKSGAWFDNVIDRVSDTLMLVCLIPTGLSVVNGFDFKWMIWTNIFIIFLYEYIRARHEGLGLHETKPTIGERIVRIMVNGTFFTVYGVSSLTVLLTNLAIGSTSPNIWAGSHEGVTNWTMFIYQIVLLAIMIFSIIILAKYTWKELKKLDKANGE
ncbi:MAG: CDP-alcohol phosphatidyltransferase family protein [Candidatus Thorarchaeota archaeon]